MKHLKLILSTCSILTMVFAAAQSKADFVFHNGKIYTLDKDRPWAEAVAVKDSVISFVGTTKDCAKWIGRNTKVIDLKNRMLMPGFVDGHNHYIAGSLPKQGVNLTAVTDRKEILNRIKSYIAENPNRRIHTGYGLNFMVMQDLHLDRHTMDSLCVPTPIFIFNEDGHMVLCNSRTLALAEITKETKDPSEKSYYVRQADGTPSGILVENEAYMPAVFAIGYFEGKNSLEQLMADNFANLAKWGITSYYDMGIFAPTLAEASMGYDLLREWEKAGKLKVRVSGTYGVREANLSPRSTIDTMKVWQKRYNSRLVSIRALKIWSDGTADSHTGVQLEPYANNPGTKGESDWTAHILQDFMVAAYKADFDVIVHTQGDGSTRRTLDAFEATEKMTDFSQRRSAIHHANVIDPTDLPRFKTLQLGVNGTLEWLSTGWDNAYILYGAEKVKRAYEIWPRLAAMGVNTTYGSDIPGTNPDEAYPLYQIQAALTGSVPYFTPKHPRFPDRIPSLEQMIQGYTINGAYSMHMENRIGSIEIGKLADLIILDKNIFSVPQDNLATIRVDMTMLNGKVIHEVVAKKTK